MSGTRASVSRTFKVPPQEVFVSWTDPARISLWMAPAGWRYWATVDPRPEGSFRLGMELPDSDTIESQGTYEEVFRPQNSPSRASGQAHPK